VARARLRLLSRYRWSRSFGQSSERRQCCLGSRKYHQLGSDALQDGAHVDCMSCLNCGRVPLAAPSTPLGRVGAMECVASVSVESLCAIQADNPSMWANKLTTTGMASSSPFTDRQKVADVVPQAVSHSAAFRYHCDLYLETALWCRVWRLLIASRDQVHRSKRARVVWQYQSASGARCWHGNLLLGPILAQSSSYIKQGLVFLVGGKTISRRVIILTRCATGAGARPCLPPQRQKQQQMRVGRTSHSWTPGQTR